MSEIVLKLSNVSVGYDNSPLLKKINLTLHEGEVVALLGRNGSGKSTLLKTLSHILSPVHGEILIQGDMLHTLSQVELSKRMAIVLTEKLDLDHLTVRDVISMGRYPHTNFFGKLTKKDHNIIEQLIIDLELSTLDNSYYRNLSDGEKQRVQMARAFAQDTPIILMDEPGSFLDASKKMEMISLIKKIAKERQCAILFSSHDFYSVLSLVDRTLAITAEQTLLDYTPEELILHDHLKEIYPSSEISFNGDSGHFHGQKHQTKELSISGENSQNKRWTKHFLEKSGFIVNEKEKGDLEVTPLSWIFKKRNYTTLTDLITDLKEL